ncbi:hypothetical protein THAOC_35430, partial [Thalassiosira oceanica]
AKSANFGPFLYLALLLTTISYFEGVGEPLLNPATAVAENGSSQNRAMEHPRRPPSGGYSTARFANIQFLASSAAAKRQAFFARSVTIDLPSQRARVSERVTQASKFI